jgi:hypothetical protein
MTFDRDEVEAAFRKYWELGAVGEDWDAWCDECFTADVAYIEHQLGNRNGREEVRAWIKPTMEEYGSIYTVYEWHIIEGDRLVVSMQNRRDHPDASKPPIDFRGITILEYAGDGQFSSEEDFWSIAEGVATMKEWIAATRDHADFLAQRSRRDWGTGPAWTIGAPDFAGSLGGKRAG